MRPRPSIEVAPKQEQSQGILDLCGVIFSVAGLDPRTSDCPCVVRHLGSEKYPVGGRHCPIDRELHCCGLGVGVGVVHGLPPVHESCSWSEWNPEKQRRPPCGRSVRETLREHASESAESRSCKVPIFLATSAMNGLYAAGLP